MADQKVEKLDPNNPGALLIKHWDNKDAVFQVGTGAGKLTVNLSVAMGGDTDFEERYLAFKNKGGVNAVLDDKGRDTFPRSIIGIDYNHVKSDLGLKEVTVEDTDLNSNTVKPPKTITVEKLINDVVAEQLDKFLVSNRLKQDAANRLKATFKIDFNGRGGSGANYLNTPADIQAFQDELGRQIHNCIDILLTPGRETATLRVQQTTEKINRQIVNVQNAATPAQATLPPAPPGTMPPPPAQGPQGGGPGNPPQGGAPTGTGGPQQPPQPGTAPQGGAGQVGTGTQTGQTQNQAPQQQQNTQTQQQQPQRPPHDIDKLMRHANINDSELQDKFEIREDYWHVCGTRMRFLMNKTADGQIEGKIIVQHWPEASARDRSVADWDPDANPPKEPTPPDLEISFDIGNNDYTYEERLALINKVRTQMRMGRSAEPSDIKGVFFRGVTGRVCAESLCHLDTDPRFKRKAERDDEILRRLDKVAERMNKQFEAEETAAADEGRSIVRRRVQARRQLVAVDDYDSVWDKHNRLMHPKEERLNKNNANETVRHETIDIYELYQAARDKEAAGLALSDDEQSAIDAWNKLGNDRIDKDGNERKLGSKQWEKIVQLTHRTIFGQNEYRLKTFTMDESQGETEFTLAKREWQDLIYFHDDDGHYLYINGDLQVPYQRLPEDGEGKNYNKDDDVMAVKAGSIDKDHKRTMMFIWLGDFTEPTKKIWNQLDDFADVFARDYQYVKQHDDMFSKSKIVEYMWHAIDKDRRPEDGHPTSKTLVGIFRGKLHNVIWPRARTIHMRQCDIENSFMAFECDSATFSNCNVRKSQIIFKGADGGSAKSVKILRGNWERSVELYGGIASGSVSAHKFQCNMLGMDEFSPKLQYKTKWEMLWAMWGCWIEEDIIKDKRLRDLVWTKEEIPIFGTFAYEWKRAGMMTMPELMRKLAQANGAQVYMEQLDPEYKGGSARTGSVRHGVWRCALAGKDNDSRLELFGYRDTPEELKKKSRLRYVGNLMLRSVPIVRSLVNENVLNMYMEGDNCVGFANEVDNEGNVKERIEADNNETAGQLFARIFQKIGSPHTITPYDGRHDIPEANKPQSDALVSREPLGAVRQRPDLSLLQGPPIERAFDENGDEIERRHLVNDYASRN